MVISTRAKFNKYVELYTENTYLIFPCCIIDINGEKKTVVSKVATSSKIYEENQTVLIQYDTDDVENFIILESINDKKLIIGSMLFVVGVIILWLLLQKYGITIRPIQVI